MDPYFIGGDIDTSTLGLGTVKISMTFSNAIGDLDMWLEDPDRKIVAQSDGNTDGEYIEYRLSKTGKYRLRVYGYDYATNNYVLNISFTTEGSLPLANAGGPYSGVAGTPVNFDSDGKYNVPH